MIRLAKHSDLKRILEIYSVAKDFMHRSGNPTQWNGVYPDAETLSEDIKKEQLFVMEDEESQSVYGCFALIGGEDPTYEYIEGSWMADTSYGTIHRIASDGTRKGVFEECVRFSRTKYDHLRVDTHEDNKPMQHVILRNGFTYTGIIFLANGDPRKAYEWVEDVVDEF